MVPDKWRKRRHHGKTHPTVDEEFDEKTTKLFLRSKRWKCAFTSIKKLKKWFNNEEIKRLRKLGFKVVEIQAKVVHKGNVQVIFKGRTSTRKIKNKEL